MTFQKKILHVNTLLIALSCTTLTYTSDTKNNVAKIDVVIAQLQRLVPSPISITHISTSPSPCTIQYENNITEPSPEDGIYTTTIGNTGHRIRIEESDFIEYNESELNNEAQNLLTEIRKDIYKAQSTTSNLSKRAKKAALKAAIDRCNKYLDKLD